MPRVVLINGAPGSGKSTLAHALAQDRRLTLAFGHRRDQALLDTPREANVRTAAERKVP